MAGDAQACCDLAVLEDDVAPSRWKPEMWWLRTSLLSSRLVCHFLGSAARRRSGHGGMVVVDYLVPLGVRKMITTMWRRLFCGLRPVWPVACQWPAIVLRVPGGKLE
ncbi:hypothetical protein CSPX01_14804 [Colletotrichum filicis]|nr:hypothetical protein CSPX01_14804 [Colletotrichum filicis]